MQTFYDIGTTDEISDFFSYPGCDSSPGNLPGPFLSGMWQCRCIRESIQRDNECVLLQHCFPRRGMTGRLCQNLSCHI
jgi:hypothetical protein